MVLKFSFSLLLLPLLAAAKCPLNWVQYEDNCYFYSQMVTKFDAAEQICQTRGGHLASIHSLKQNRFIIRDVIGKNMPGSFLPVAYIGGYWNFTTNTTAWTDGSPMDFTNFETFMRSNVTILYSPTCITLAASNLGIQTKGKWYYLDTESNYAEGFVCQVPACDTDGKSAPSILAQNSTGFLSYMATSNSWFYGFAYCFNRCCNDYNVENLCQSFGAHLPSVHNAFENTDLVNAFSSLYDQQGQDPSFKEVVFGLYSLDNGTTWYFTDRTRVAYTNWGSNDPKMYSSYSVISGIDGKWHSDEKWQTIDGSQRNVGCQIRIDQNLCQ